MNLIAKTLQALWEGWSVCGRTSSPRVVMTLLAKNEEEMLEQNLIFHKSMGVDAFIITDNNSTDRTPAIIDKYVAKGWVVEVIKETATNYEQKEWVDRMIWIAKSRYHADWVINADADEFWCPATRDFKALLASLRCNVVRCTMRSMFPEEDKPFSQWTWAVKPVATPETYNLSKYSLYERQNFKVIHRAKGYLQISMGNHKVKMLPQVSVDGDVIVYHFNIRGRKPFLEKIINGGKQLEQHKGRHGGRHWRYFYKLYKEGEFDKEYDRVIGLNYLSQLKQDGYLYKDDTLAGLLQQIMPQ